MLHYYEISINSHAVMGFEELEDAIMYCDMHDINEIDEIGGTWTNYIKCNICGDWFDSNDIDTNGLCYGCSRLMF